MRIYSYTIIRIQFINAIYSRDKIARCVRCRVSFVGRNRKEYARDLIFHAARERPFALGSRAAGVYHSESSAFTYFRERRRDATAHVV